MHPPEDFCGLKSSQLTVIVRMSNCVQSCFVQIRIPISIKTKKPKNQYS